MASKKSFKHGYNDEAENIYQCSSPETNNEVKQTQDKFNQNVANKLVIDHNWRTKALDILSKKNYPEIEREFRIDCSLYESQCYACDQPLSQEYQEFINTYHQTTTLYLIDKEINRTKLFVYDTESEKEKVKILDAPQPLHKSMCITQLPNGDLFCFGSYPASEITLIIDRSYGVRVLPSGSPCCLSSSIYFNRNIYCFGGINNDHDGLTLSRKFVLYENRWINLSPMPQADFCCYSAIFNRNILISGYENRNLLLYSIDIDSFSIIPYEFAPRKRKILINIERLYLIECGNGLIYESEAGDAYTWKQISKSIISNNCPAQVYCSYNKGGIYISASLAERYYKFDLAQNIMIKL